MTSQTAPAVILVHGFLDSGEVWRPVLQLIGAATNGWSTPDLPGMGKLWDAYGPFSLPHHADAITDLIDQVNGDIVLVGQSMGTQIVELAARNRPQRIVGLILLSPIPLAGAHAPAEVAGLLLQLLTIRVVGFSIATGLLFALVARGFGERRWWLSVPSGLLISLLIWLIFARGLALTLPSGPVEQALSNTLTAALSASRGAPA